jgi:hypothetical protein
MPRNVPIPLERPYSLGEEQAALDSPPGSRLPHIAHASATDRSNKSVSANASTTPAAAASAYAPALSEAHNGDPAPPFFIQATNVRSFY